MRQWFIGGALSRNPGRRDHQLAVARAADAFRIKDFKRVVALLLPHEKRLTDAERKKLAYARAHLGERG